MPYRQTLVKQGKQTGRQIIAEWRKATTKVKLGVGKEAKSTQLRVHDLRHAYAIRLAEAGCPMHFISEVLGHHSIDFTRKRYAKFSPDSASRGVRQFLEKNLEKKEAVFATTMAPAIS